MSTASRSSYDYESDSVGQQFAPINLEIEGGRIDGAEGKLFPEKLVFYPENVYYGADDILELMNKRLEILAAQNPGNVRHLYRGGADGDSDIFIHCPVTQQYIGGDKELHGRTVVNRRTRQLDPVMNEHIVLRDTTLHWHIYVDTKTNSPNLGKLIANIKWNLIDGLQAGPGSARRGERNNPRARDYQIEIDSRFLKDIISEIKTVIIDSIREDGITELYPVEGDPTPHHSNVAVEMILVRAIDQVIFELIKDMEQMCADAPVYATPTAEEDYGEPIYKYYSPLDEARRDPGQFAPIWRHELQLRDYLQDRMPSARPAFEI